MGWGTCAQVSPSEQLARAHLSVCPDPVCLGQCAPEPGVGVDALGEEPGAQAEAQQPLSVQCWPWSGRGLHCYLKPVTNSRVGAALSTLGGRAEVEFRALGLISGALLGSERGTGISGGPSSLHSWIGVWAVGQPRY